MTDEQAFLSLALVAFVLAVVYVAAPAPAILLAAVLIAVLYVACRDVRG